MTIFGGLQNVKLFNINILLLLFYEICLIGVCLAGDFMLHFTNTSNQKTVRDENIRLWTRAFADSLTHGLVALFSWAIVINFNFKGVQIIPILASFILAVSVDFDHFIAAKSIEIKDVLNLSKRPPFHASTIILLVSVSTWILGYIPHLYHCKTFSLLFLTSWLSHHIRDGTRRGLWFPPIGSTPPIPYLLYIGLIVILPLIVRYIYVSAPDK